MIPKRYLLVAAMFSLSVLLYVDRACISAAKTAVATDLNLTDKQMGWVLSSFAVGYALCQTPAGLLADKLGPRFVLTLVVSIWSLFTGLTALAWNYTAMLVVRFLFGAGEAGAFPGMARTIYSWIPMRERGVVQGINFSGSRLGAAFAFPLVVYLVDRFGWKMSFGILMGVGFVWAIGWYLFFKDNPAEDKGLSAEEREFLAANLQQSDAEAGGKPAPFNAGILFGSRNMWIAMAQYFCSNFTFFFCLTWLFPYVKETYKLGSVEAGFYASAPLVFGAIGNVFSGFLVDQIYRRGHWHRSRRIPAMLGFGLAAAGLLMSLQMDTAFGAVAWLSLAIFGADMTLSPSWTFCIDIGRKNAGAVSGTMNMAGNVGSFVTGLAFPYLMAWTGGPKAFFFVGAGLNVLAIFLWTMARPDRKLEDY